MPLALGNSGTMAELHREFFVLCCQRKTFVFIFIFLFFNIFPIPNKITTNRRAYLCENPRKSDENNTDELAKRLRRARVSVRIQIEKRRCKFAHTFPSSLKIDFNT